MSKILKKEIKLSRKRLIIYIAFIVILLYLIYAIYLLVKEPTNKVTVEQRNIIFGRN